MSDALVDSNVIIDILDADPNWANWSRERAREIRRSGTLVINPLIYAEVAGAYTLQNEAERALSAGVYRRENLPWEAAFNAGRVFRAYRRAGGAKRSPLPDFYIGAHAEVKGYVLLTRDPRRYREYFPTLNIIAPDTHP
jgi:predicted nucleic acid-binding protein